MTRDDAIIRLRRQLPRLQPIGITGLSLVGETARQPADAWNEIEVMLDIDLDAHPKFDLLALVGVQLDLENELGIPVRAFVEQGMRPEAREMIGRDAVRIA